MSDFAPPPPPPPSPALAPGSVALVGAGPGDPNLITVAGVHLLQQATVVVYDALANPKLLGWAPEARHVYAGKRAAHHSMTQDDINALLVKEAQNGETVVRLKGGDPFVFGRGGEEAEALVAAGVPFVVVPGITAAVAAAAYAGIPITHRDLNTSLTLVTGHEKERAKQHPEAAARQEADAARSENTDWAALAKLPLLCFYMGVRSLPGIADKLIAAGMSPDTPAASVQWGTMPRQKVVVATLSTLPDANAKAGLGSPAITYVGEVVRLRGQLRWFDHATHRPLLGKTIVVTRTRQQASDLSAKLSALGANVIEAPTIRIEPPSDGSAVDRALRSLSRNTGFQPVQTTAEIQQFASTEKGTSLARAGSPCYDWIVFTSPNGVARTWHRMDETKLDSRIFANVKVAAVGPATAQACRWELRRNPDLVPKRFNADELADAFGDVAGQRFLLLRADIGRASLVETLRERGATVEDVAVYETKPVDSLPADLLAALDAGEVDAVTFTSGSTARNLANLLGDVSRLGRSRLVSIGPKTSEAMTEAGLRVDAEAREATLDSLVEATRGLLR